MARIELQSLPDDARTWIFGISPRVDNSGAAEVLGGVEQFIESWKSHGDEIVGAADVIDGSFLVVAITPESETSGCSIDKMFGQLRALESKLGVSIVDSDRIFYRDQASEVRAVPRHEFRGVATPDTKVFDTTAERLADLRNGTWEKPASNSWHARLLS